MNTKQKGFSLAYILVTIVVIGGIGAIGWYVYVRNHKPVTKNQSATSSTPKSEKAQTKPSEAIDKEASLWQSTTSRQKGFSLRIPDGWQVYNYGGADNIRSDEINYSPGVKAVVNTPATPYAGDGLVRFTVFQFTNGANYVYLDGGEQKTPFTVGSLKGSRYYKQYPLEELTGIGPIPGEQRYTYEFKTTGKTTVVQYRLLNKNQYSAGYLKDNYNQTMSDPNRLDLIERVVKTLSIH